MQWLLLPITLLLASASSAFAQKLYTNTSTTAARNTADLRSQILQALDAAASRSTPVDNLHSSTTVATTLFTAKPTSNYPIHANVFTAPPNVGPASYAMNTAAQCWSEIATWRNQSASFWNSQVANRTWSITSFSSSTTGTWTSTSTIYPANASTYTLCDGSARVNVRPKTTTWNGTSTVWGSFTTTMTPTFRPQPCSLEPRDCRALYFDTDIMTIDEREVLRQCGHPAHLEGGELSCLIGGGPVDLIYFPVQRNDSAICGSKTYATSAAPMITGLSEITTLGRTFTSASVYISFKTLYATYDGFWDTVGPTFTDLIVPLHSSDISSHCGGWHKAYGTGVPLDYADLNWPVPASAYSCQNRCSGDQTSSMALTDGWVRWVPMPAPTPSECSTIWSDVNPILALPTKIRDMVPEWSTCSFWNNNLANFWFDPPLALKSADVADSITRPSEPEATPAAPSPLPSSPLAQNTQLPVSNTVADVQSAISSSKPLESTPAAVIEFPVHLAPAGDETTSKTSVAQSPEFPNQPNTWSPDAHNQMSPTATVPATEHENAPDILSFVFDPLSISTGQSEASVEVFNPVIATAAAVSILLQALPSQKPQQTTTDPVPGTLPASFIGALSAIEVHSGVIALGSTTLSVSSILTLPQVDASVRSTGPALTSANAPSAVSSQEVKPQVVVIDGNTLSAGGAAATIAGQVLTKASNGLFIVGTPTGLSPEGVETLPPVVVLGTPSNDTVSDATFTSQSSTANVRSGNSSTVSITSSSSSNVQGDRTNVAEASPTTSIGESAALRLVSTPRVVWLLNVLMCVWTFQSH
ncbi:unnamed protein product [Zymoseptoria tritici ST99CH_1E4]|uniref:Uncharacterized protein n=1 Tax=Zymoseptoria tritici ST99CH_1E4 TaxID=1276532 RepID=A0A2H1H560_ZYMTR|nr:unnamed protein product [Zymoseptoria tritici ST99CH_1E4]